MIIVQALDKDVISTHTTLKGFFAYYGGDGANINSYDYVRKELRKKDSVRYKHFILTFSIPIIGTGNITNKKKKKKPNDEFVFKL